MFSSIFAVSADTTQYIYGTHNAWLVLFSIGIAIFASFMALQIAGMARSSERGFQRQTAIITGAIALGGGIWSMHFIGMLAFDICTRVSFDPGLTLLSMLPGMAASWVALHMLARPSINWRQLVVGGVLVGVGIGSMHYSGMAAMQTSLALRYEPWLFALSLLVAVTMAMLALWVRFGLNAMRQRLSPLASLLLSSVVMGLAISGMHYTGMLAARFSGTPTAGENTITVQASFVALAVALITVTLTVFVAAANGLLRYRQLLRHASVSESRLRAIVDTAADGLITIDGQGKVRSFNPAAESLFGWREAEIVGRDASVLLQPADAAQYEGYLRDYLETGASRILDSGRELDGRHKDGAVLPMRVAIGKIDTPGQPLFVAFVTDMRSSRSMEQALKDSERQYRTLIRNIPGVSFHCSFAPEWKMIFISDAVFNLTGWMPQDFVEGRVRIFDLVHPDDRQRVNDTCVQAAGERRDFENVYRMIHRDGRERWVRESSGPVLDNDGVVRWIDGVILDITESELRNAEYEGKVTAISRATAVAEFDLQGRILAANQNFLDLTGYQLEDVLGLHHSVFCEPRYVTSPDYVAFWQHLAHGEFNTGEYKRLGKDGREVWIQASYNPIFNTDGKPFKVVKLATDVSERRAMQENLRAAKDRAELAAESKTSFLANMSHEIRTPMNAIIGFTEVLLGTALDSLQRRHLGTVRQSARSLLELLNDILDMAKLEKGATELELVDFSLPDLVDHVAASLRITAQARDLVLHVDVDPGMGQFFLGDARRVQQVLTNLIGNAVKFTEVGHVRVAVGMQGEKVHIAVHDTGIGIPADRLDKIFAPFTQADSSMSRRFGGTGLGTTISLQLVELMGGTITVESTLGVGSVFHVLLPLAPGKAVSRRSEQPVVALPPLRILAADDVPQNVELLLISLGAAGHQVIAASDGESAVREFSKGSFDVVLMDVQMPRMDGLEATRLIRVYEREQGLKATPIIALTASVLEQDRRAAQTAGMNGFASKPLEMHKLTAEIARLLDIAVAMPPPAAGAAARAATGQVDWQRGIALWGGREALQRAIGRFVQANGDCAAMLAAELERGGGSVAGHLLHRIKGAAGNLCLVQVESLLGRIEQAIARQLPATELLVQLAAAFMALAGELEESGMPAVAVGTPVAGVPLDAPAFGALLRQAIASLEGGQLDDALMAQIAAMLAPHGQQPRLQALTSAIDDFEFARAAGVLRQLLAWLETPAPADLS
ncbi:PAS domain S-box-containing protein [Janthinobacterium sp. OK676]|uniref:PAS domain S-box protein n=1 Tax=unclassified Janthinobacterium TaxID=2610881 RepID=UPI000889A1ED|nr:MULTISPECIES: PAS domain S-box protein [unclassified Janthinobacterium]PJJ18062.1 PAS domain S-box-containing protein [Janthinobacterium sp. 67]SDL54153.1 PAS domain S-box-containing protein [Janthinobacterium sp. OK676]